MNWTPKNSPSACSRGRAYTRDVRHGSCNSDKELRTTLATLAAPDRGWAYRIAAATGFRASEVRALTPDCFDLSSDTPTISPESAKNGSDVQPIHLETADTLRPWLARKPAALPVCRVPADRLDLCPKST